MKVYGIWVLFLAVFVEAASIFGEKSGVKHLTARNFKDRVLYDGNVTAVVFYAPWCGYCKQLGPEWAKTAKELKGIAQVAAVNCNADVNKQLCAKYEVQGFPTIKVFQPAKLTDIDFKDAVADGKPLPKRRPKMFSYNGPREHEEITKFIVGKLRNYVATLDSEDALLWLATNSVPRVLMLPGTNYKSIQVSPLLKVLSREYFGRLRFATVPRRVDGTWNLLGMKAIEESQLVYMSDDKEPILYKGSMKKKLIKQFIDEQYELEMSRRRQRGLESPSRDTAANGFEFVTEDAQTEPLEHVVKREERIASIKSQAEAERAAAFARHGKEMPGYVATAGKSSSESTSSTLTTTSAATSASTATSAATSASTATPASAASSTNAPEDEGEDVDIEEFEFDIDTESATGSDAKENAQSNAAAGATENSEEADDEDPDALESAFEDDDGDSEAALDTTITEINADLIVQEGPEAIASYLAAHHIEPSTVVTDSEATSTSIDSALVTPHTRTHGLEEYDDFVLRCLRSGYNCGLVVTTNETLKNDLRPVVAATEQISKKLKTRTLFEYTIADEHPEIKEFLDTIGLTQRPGLLWWDSGRQKYLLYEGGWDTRDLHHFISDAIKRKVKVRHELPSKYLYWVTKVEVDALLENEQLEKEKKLENEKKLANEKLEKDEDEFVKQEL